MFAGLAGCQQLQVPVAQNRYIKYQLERLTIQRDNLPTSTKPNENIEAEAVELNAPDSTMIPESDLPVITVAPQDLDPQLFLGQSPDQLAKPPWGTIDSQKRGQCRNLAISIVGLCC